MSKSKLLKMYEILWPKIQTAMNVHICLKDYIKNTLNKKQVENVYEKNPFPVTNLFV